MTGARGAECTVESANLWAELTHIISDSQVVHPSSWAFHEMGHRRHRVRAAWDLGVGPEADLRNKSSRVGMLFHVII